MNQQGAVEQTARVAFARIMACVTASPHLGSVVREAGALAAGCGSELAFLHVGSDAALVEGRVREALEGQPERLRGARVVARPGEPVSVILKEAGALGADLVYAGALREDPLLRDLIGSVARRLVRRADRSVYLSVHRAPTDRPVRTLVACVDLDAPSQTMLATLLPFARGMGVETLHIVHEYDPYTVGVAESTGSAGADRDAYERTAAATRRFQLADVLSTLDLSGLNVRTAVLRGRHRMETAAYAERHSADLLMVPSPGGRLGFLDRFFGHPTERLLRQLPCSLLVHRPVVSRTARGGGGGSGGGER